MTKSIHVDEEVDTLFTLRPGEFVAARDALAKRLRHTGHRAEADAVHGLARPTTAAWAINQLARSEPEWMRALATAGERLAQAHDALLNHGDREAWRTATTDQRQSIERLLRLAEQLLREERGSVSAALRDQVRQTLQAATLDPDARAAVLEGRLSRELYSPGTLPADLSGRFTRTPGTTGDPGTGRGRAGSRATERGDGARAGGPGTERGAGPATEAPAEQGRDVASGGRATERGAGRATEAPAERVRETARGSRAGGSSAAGGAAQREARAARRAAERVARAVLRRVEREQTGAAIAVHRSEQAVARARKAREAAAEALAEAERIQRARDDELEAAEAAYRDARSMLAAREAAVAEARAEVERAMRR